MAILNKAMATALTVALDAQKGQRANGKRARENTDLKHGEVVRAAFGRLEVLGFNLTKPNNITQHHLQVLVKDWMATQKANKTMQNNRSRMKLFFTRIGKQPDFFKPLHEYLKGVDPNSLKVSNVAKKSKSWSELGIDVLAKLKEADEIDNTGRLGLMLRVMLAFGLRRREVLCCFPWKSGAVGSAWQVYASEGKNNRPRMVTIQMPEQKALIDRIKQQIKPGQMLRWDYTPHGKEPTLAWAERRFKYYMDVLGLTKKVTGGTAHGLRSEYAENAAMIMQFIPPTLGGTGAEHSKAVTLVKREVVSSLLGHVRPDITNSYYGKFPKHPIGLSSEQYAEAINVGIAEVTQKGYSTNIPHKLKGDCLAIAAAMIDAGPNMSFGHAFALWTIHSARFGLPWIKPQTDGEIHAGIYVAATKHTREEDTAGK